MQCICSVYAREDVPKAAGPFYLGSMPGKVKCPTGIGEPAVWTPSLYQVSHDRSVRDADQSIMPTTSHSNTVG